MIDLEYWVKEIYLFLFLAEEILDELMATGSAVRNFL